jgi:hypothetical protein
MSVSEEEEEEGWGGVVGPRREGEESASVGEGEQGGEGDGGREVGRLKGEARVRSAALMSPFEHEAEANWASR